MPAMLSALLLVLPAASARSASGVSTGLIAFARSDGIYVMHPDGSGQRALRRGDVASRAVDLAWSPDGRRLAFATGDAIWRIDADGGRLLRLARAARDMPGDLLVSVGWAPDGRRLIYTAKRGTGNGNREIWTVGADGSHRRLLATTSRWEWDVALSPKGNRIAFTDYEGYFAQVWLANADGSKPHLLFWPFSFQAESPAWSPDGRTLAVSHSVSSRTGNADIYLVDVDSGRRVQLTRNALAEREPSWSPDGRKLVFTRGSVEPRCPGCPLPTSGKAEIYVMNADGTGVTRLTDNQIEEASPVWQPVATS